MVKARICRTGIKFFTRPKSRTARLDHKWNCHALIVLAEFQIPALIKYVQQFKKKHEILR